MTDEQTIWGIHMEWDDGTSPPDTKDIAIGWEALGASTDPPTRTQDARVQELWLSPEISLNSRSHLQHFQRPTPSHFCKDTPSLSCGGYEHVARGSRGRLKIFETQNSRVLL
jgi:hypothetical protein